jgi:hypothetical protein
LFFGMRTSHGARSAKRKEHRDRYTADFAGNGEGSDWAAPDEVADAMPEFTTDGR